MRSLEARGPFFLVVFFSTAHFPYAAPSPLLRGASPTRATAGASSTTSPWASAPRRRADARDEKQVRALYDGAVSAIDDAAQRVLDALDGRRDRRRTVVVVTADHGETLYDHGHGAGPRRPPVRRRGDARAAGRRRPPRTAVGPHREPAIVRDVDLAPTLYALTGVAPPARPRRPVARPALGGRAARARAAPTPRRACGSPRTSRACRASCASPTPASRG